MKKHINKLDVYVCLSLIVPLVYTVVCLILAVFDKAVNDTLTTCLFGLFGGETFACILVKWLNIKKKGDNDG